MYVCEQQAEEELEVMKKMQEAQTMPRLSTIRERKTNPKEQKQDVNCLLTNFFVFVFNY